MAFAHGDGLADDEGRFAGVDPGFAFLADAHIDGAGINGGGGDGAADFHFVGGGDDGEAGEKAEHAHFLAGMVGGAKGGIRKAGAGADDHDGDVVVADVHADLLKTTVVMKG